MKDLRLFNIDKKLTNLFFKIEIFRKGTTSSRGCTKKFGMQKMPPPSQVGGGRKKLYKLIKHVSGSLFYNFYEITVQIRYIRSKIYPPPKKKKTRTN